MSTPGYWNPFEATVKYRFLSLTFQICTQSQQVTAFNLPAKDQLLSLDNNNAGPQLCGQVQNKANNLNYRHEKLESCYCVVNFNMPS